MSVQLTFGGSSIQLVRDKGSANSVAGFTLPEATQGPKLTSSLPTVFLLDAETDAASIQIVALQASEFWLNLLGTWVQTETWQNVSGAWAIQQPNINVSGVWK
jgi:hypothetical protein